MVRVEHGKQLDNREHRSVPMAEVRNEKNEMPNIEGTKGEKGRRRGRARKLVTRMMNRRGGGE